MRNGKESDRIHLRLKPSKLESQLFDVNCVYHFKYLIFQATQIYDEIPVPVKKNQVAHRAPNTHSSNNMVREISE